MPVAKNQETPTASDDDFNRELEGYTVAYEDSGYKIELKGTPTNPDSFEGIYQGTKAFQVVNKFTDKEEEVIMLCFKDLKGAACNIWANYALTEALKSGQLTSGKQVKLVHHGKEEIKDGTQQLSKYSVYVKN